MRKIFFVYSMVGVISLFLFAPGVARAAEMTFEVTPAGDGALVEVYIDPRGQELNVVEGAIGIRGESGKDISVAVENGESILTLWPVAPQYDMESAGVRFSGGTPGGFSSKSLVMRLRLQSSVPESVVVSWLDGMAYLNDGKGTQDLISAKSVVLKLGKQNGEADSAQSRHDAGVSGGIIRVLIVTFFAFIYGYKKFLSK